MITDNSFSVRPTTQEEKDAGMPYVTSSMMEAVATCPRWGVIRNVQRKTFTTGFRQMALEAGSLMHEVYALLNLLHVGHEQGLKDHATYYGIIEFGEDRWNTLNPFENEDPSINDLEKMIFTIIGTSEFYDDPKDAIRTINNMELCALELLGHWLVRLKDLPIYVADRKDAQAPIGIEMSVDVVYTWQGQDYRFIGMLDTLYQNIDGIVTPGDYKTSSNTNDAWRLAFQTRHQMSGYYGALLGRFENVAEKFIIVGSNIPVRKTRQSVQQFSVKRNEEDVKKFLIALVHSFEVVNRYPDAEVLNAPMYTHSCNRFFRPCSLLDLCSADMEDQIVMYEQMYDDPDRSPSEIKALLRSE